MILTDDVIEDFHGYLYAFHPTKGFLLLWSSEKNLDQKKEKQLSTFINFASSLITHAKATRNHPIFGPLIVRDLHTHLALIKPLASLQNDDSLSTDNNDVLLEMSFCLIILYPVDLDRLITGESRRLLALEIDKTFQDVSIEKLDDDSTNKCWIRINEWWISHLYQKSSPIIEMGSFTRLASLLQQANSLLKNNNLPRQWLIGGRHKSLSYLLPEVFYILLSKFPSMKFSFQHEKDSFSRLTLEYLEIECHFAQHFVTAPIKDFNIFFLNDVNEWQKLQVNVNNQLNNNENVKTRIIIISRKNADSVDLSNWKNKIGRIMIEQVIFDWLEDVSELPDIITDLFQEELEQSLNNPIK